jgi:hypothetical protein
VVVLSGCAFAPSGPVVSEDRDISAATGVVLETSGDLTIREGDPSLVIHAPAAVLERLTSSVDDGVLTLGVKPGTPGFRIGKISYELTLPSLESLEVDGSGDIESDIPGDDLAIAINGSGEVDIDDIDAGTVSLDISGSGDVELSGRAERLDISIDGSADVRAEDLATKDVSVDLDGSGDIDVRALGTLEVSLSGSGSVSYEGDPEVTQDISGSGEVSRR